MKVVKEGYSGRLGRDRSGEDLKENNERFWNNESENSTEDVMTVYTIHCYPLRILATTLTMSRIMNRFYTTRVFMTEWRPTDATGIPVRPGQDWTGCLGLGWVHENLT